VAVAVAATKVAAAVVEDFLIMLLQFFLLEH